MQQKRKIDDTISCQMDDTELNELREVAFSKSKNKNDTLVFIFEKTPLIIQSTEQNSHKKSSGNLYEEMMKNDYYSTPDIRINNLNLDG